MSELDPHEEEEVGKVYDSALMKRLIGYARPYWAMGIGAVLLILLSSALQLVGPLVTALTLDLFVEPPADESTRSIVTQWAAQWMAHYDVAPEPKVGILLAAGIYALATALSLVVLYVQGYVMNMMGQEIMYDLRREVFDRLQRQSVSYFDHRPVGRLVTRATNDISSLNELFTSGLVAIFGDIMMLSGIVAVLFALDWRMALVTFSVLPLLLVLTLWFKSRARAMYRRIRTRLAKINAFLQEHLSGISVVQLFGREYSELKDFEEIADDYRHTHIKAILYYAIYYPGVEIITSLGLALIIWYGGGQILSGAMTLGALVAFLQYSQRFYQPLADLSDKYNILQGAMASSERIFELLDAELEIETPDKAHVPQGIRGAVEFDRVKFSYLPDEPVLCGLSFRIEPGETVAVVGHTGAGKSTLASLLLRFYDVDQGSVSIDGVDVRQWDLKALRGNIAMVLQDVFLFAGSLADNIRLGRQEIDDDAIRRAANEVHALDFIDQLPDGFETELKERGSGLSVGQKQLIAFARALAFDPQILILDEATASIDTETEQHIQAALDRLLRGRTSLIIAHRLSTIRKADRILVLHRGELREQGTHDELLKRAGLYRKLYELQLEQETEDSATGSAEPVAEVVGET